MEPGRGRAFLSLRERTEVRVKGIRLDFFSARGLLLTFSLREKETDALP
jgi:hypothetical protein